jgi:serine/threonine-protein kinase
MKCLNCGTSVRPTANFCPTCGAAVTGSIIQHIALQPGQAMKQGAYHIVGPLSKGGMGALYLAEDTQAFNRLCVIKEMLDYFDPSDPQEVKKARKLFEDEARTLSTLSHPGIPKIYTYFSENNRNYIVMEYVEGDNLESGLTHEDENGNWIAGKPQLLPEVLRWTVQVCRILEYLGTCTPPVVHHDIKPANLISDKNSGEVRLVDFGTAKARLTLQPGGTVGLHKSSIYGTAGYAAPEQYGGGSEPRSDVYALAATAYHLLTDDGPYDHPFKFPKLGILPPGVRGILSQALDQDVNRRPIAFQMRQELEKVLKPIPHARLDDLDTNLDQLVKKELPAFIKRGRTRAKLTITNRGQGHFSGKVEVSKLAPWFSVPNRWIDCPPGQTVTVDIHIAPQTYSPWKDFSFKPITIKPR